MLSHSAESQRQATVRPDLPLHWAQLVQWALNHSAESQRQALAYPDLQLDWEMLVLALFPR